MRKWIGLLVIGVILSNASYARPAKKKKIPLMPERAASSETISSLNQAPSSNPSFGLGFELGALGRQLTTDGRYSNLDVLPGGRLFCEFDVVNGLVLRPSIGYFGSSSTVGLSNVFQSDFEGGLSLYFEAAFSTESRLLFGVTNRFDIMLANVSTYSVSTSTSPIFAYRPGPALSLEIGLGGHTQLVLNGDFTFSLMQGGIPYGSATAGIVQQF